MPVKVPTLRPELEPLPLRMRLLPLDARGYPVPWFVAWEGGEPEFRAADVQKFARAIREKRCWVCGEALGQYLAFVIGPMCAVNRSTSEPPCHRECARWSARNCPFLSRPHMVRREDDEINAERYAREGVGMPILRNPGVVCVWTCRRFELRRAETGGDGYLLRIGHPESVEWYAEGRRATRAEVLASIESGLPVLRAVAAQQATVERRGAALEQLDRQQREAEVWYPE